MKKIILFSALCTLVGNAFAQKQTFDITTFTPPKGWKKQAAERAIQFSKVDAATGTYCLITLYKSVPGTASSKENFDLAWETLVKEMVTVSSAPEMHPTEADKLGLIFMSMAGYNPEEAVPFWQRMAANCKGGKLPEFLSTHPSDETRKKN